MDYDTILTGRKEIAEDIVSVYLEKPENYDFLAGQFCFLNVPDIGFRDERGLRRHLTIASSPLEKELMFATKISNSAFKRTLMVMPTGNIIKIEKPKGLFTLPENKLTPLVFLAGGIGITPFRSMLQYVADAKTNHVITLFYSNRKPEEAAFLKELQSISDRHRNITIIPTMTRIEGHSENWKGLKGRISASVIRDKLTNWHEALYYVAGPPVMVESMKEILKEMNIQQERIHIESFTGY